MLNQKCFECANIVVENLQKQQDKLYIESYCLNERGMKTHFEGCDYFCKV